jgi:predicted RNA-binding protein associated with RNAse of E/G family
VNLILPPELNERSWEMYDLCLDIWIDPQGEYQVLDQDEFDEAVDNRWIDPATASRAREELRRIIDELEAGHFPPPPVAEHDLKCARDLRARSHETR